MCDNHRSQKMGINPSDSATIDFAVPDELNYFRSRDQVRLTQDLVRRKKLGASSAVTDQQFAVNKIMAKHFIVDEKPVELARIRFGSAQETYPDGCIDEYHLYTALAGRCFPTPPWHVARARIGATQSAQALLGGSPYKRLESHAYRFGICGGAGYGASLP
jgi:hypothetical protein